MLIAATLPLIAQHGQKVTTKQIAAAAGVAEGTIFRVFADKNQLLDAAVQQAMDPEVTLAELVGVDITLPLDEDHGLDAFLDPGMRRSQLTWDDIVLPDWLRDLAEDAWQQLGGLVLDPEDPTSRTRMDELREAYDAHYAEAVAVSLDEARHRERRGSAAGAAKLRGRLKDERKRRRQAEGRLEEGGSGTLARLFRGRGR